MQDWLFSSGSCVLMHDFERRPRAQFWNRDVPSYLEVNQIFPGLWLYRGESQAQSAFNITVDRGGPRTGRLVIGTMLGGTGRVDLEGCDEQSWREDGRSFMISPVEREVRYDVSTRSGWAVVGLRLETEVLDLMWAESEIRAMVRDVLESRIEDLSTIAPIAGSVRSLSQMLLRSPYDGAMNVLYRASWVAGARISIAAIAMVRPRLFRMAKPISVQDCAGAGRLA
jgi:hypothetical protein